MAAAPADFRAADVGRGQAQAREGSLELRLEPTEDILAGARRRAAPRARRSSASPPSTAARRSSAPASKLERKGADLIVLNDVSDPAIGFESDENAVTLIDADGETEVPIASKDAIAEAILDRVDALARKQPAERLSGLY